ncbi:MAG: hypothetical protein H7Z42_02210, partial [Roseiflexaceae bacterium]|nr:hypothetical protein [Roseiflexaceae bacterium]
MSHVLSSTRAPRPGAARKQTPTIFQAEAAESGAAALAIMLGYYGRFVQLEELREACGVSRAGTTTSAIIAAAQTYGLQATERVVEI